MGKEKRKANEDPEEMEDEIKELEARLNRKKKRLAKLTIETGSDQLQSKSYTPEPIIINDAGTSKSDNPEQEHTESESHTGEPQGTNEDTGLLIIQIIHLDDIILLF